MLVLSWRGQGCVVQDFSYNLKNLAFKLSFLAAQQEMKKKKTVCVNVANSNFGSTWCQVRMEMSGDVAQSLSLFSPQPHLPFPRKQHSLVMPCFLYCLINFIPLVGFRELLVIS